MNRTLEPLAHASMGAVNPRILPASLVIGGLSSAVRLVAEVAGTPAFEQYLAQFGSAGGAIIIAYFMLRRADGISRQARADLIAQLEQERKRADHEEKARQLAERNLMAHLKGHHVIDEDGATN